MEKLLLVHGAWHNESCWEEAKGMLEEKGYEVFTVSMAGNEVGASDKDTTYQAMVKSVVDQGQSIDGDFILVGHSSGGHIIQHAAPKMADKIKKIIFNNAWLLPDGKSQFDLVPAEIRNDMRRDANNKRRCIPVDIGFVRNALANDAPAEIQDRLIDILVEQPLMLMEERAKLEAFNEMSVPMAMLYCTKDISLPPNTYKDMFLSIDRGEEIVEIEAGHECLFTEAQKFVDGLLQLLVLA